MDVADVVKEVFAAFGRRDVGSLLAIMTDDVEFWPEGTASAVARTEPYRGHDGIREYFADVDAAWEELTLTPGHLRVAANGVVAFGTAKGRTRDGVDRDVPVIWVFRLRDGLVRSARTTSTAPPL